MLPAGAVVDDHITTLASLLAPEDIIIEGGNSRFTDDIRRAADLGRKSIHYLDAGVSGGIWGLQVGYCTMVGGDEAVFTRLQPIFKSLAPENGFLYCGPAGAGHFVKMIHNGIEYGMMQAYGEGFALLEASPYREHFDYRQIARLWNQGSVIRSWLLELLERAFAGDPRLDGLTGYVDDSGEGRWTVEQAIEQRGCRAGHHPVPLPPLPVARRQRLRQPGAGRAAPGVRRPCGQAGPRGEQLMESAHACDLPSPSPLPRAPSSSSGPPAT